jgi:hypothetical protein
MHLGLLLVLLSFAAQRRKMRRAFSRFTVVAGLVGKADIGVESTR